MPSMLAPARIPVPVGGVRVDVDPFDLEPSSLRDAENWVLRDGVFQIRPGYTEVALGGEPSGRPLGIVEYVHNDGSRRLVTGTATGWWLHDATNGEWDSITGTALAGTETDFQVFRVFDRGGTKFLLGTNGANTMKKWDGVAATYSDVGGSPPRARCMAITSDRIVLFNLKSGATISGSAYDVSANKDFDAGWGTVLTGILADTPGAIVAAQEMGNLQTAVYKTDAIYMMFAQSSAIAPFRFELKAANIAGPVSPAAVVAISDGLHAFLGSDGAVYLFDGVGVSSVGRHIQKWIVDRIDTNKMTKAWGVWNPDRKELMFTFQQVGVSEPDASATIYFPTGALWPWRWRHAHALFGFTCGIAATVTTGLRLGDVFGTIGATTGTLGDYDSPQRHVVMGGMANGVAAGVFKLIGNGDVINSERVPNFFEFGMNALGDVSRWKTLVEIEHDFVQAAVATNVTVQVRSAQHRGEDPAPPTGSTFDIGAAPNYLTGHRLSARYFSYRAETDTAKAVSWRGATAYFASRGRR